MKAYPSELQQKVLAQEAPGDVPVALNIIIPSVTKPGEMFDAKVIVLDKAGYPSLKCECSVRVQIPEQDVVEIAFRRGIPAVGRLQNIRLVNEGLFRLSASCNNLKAYSNPTFCTLEDIPGIYWGDPHVHTVLSNCHADKSRSLNFCFTAARHLSALDWVAATDHVSNGRCDFSKWKEQRAVAELYNDPQEFVTLPAYEASFKSGAGGDNNVYMPSFPDIFTDEYENGNVKTLCNKLTDAMSADAFFVVPHHTTRQGKHGEISDEIYPGPDAMPVIEIHSKWGTSEYRGNPNPLKKIHEGPSYATDLLNRGLKMGFVAGTDSHATMPSGGGDEPDHLDRLPGMTAIRCAELTRQSIFNAVKHRQCYAASLERIIMHGSIAGRAFGEELHFADLTTPPEINVLVAARSDITGIDIVRNGTTIHTITPNSWKAQIMYEDREDLSAVQIKSRYLGNFIYYYVRVTCESGAQAWSSPVWILG
ncbi:MAG: hypothetical protein JXN60_07460 [Lentisphaerae bacterium]|nr:hypothetical protein [Lentisphaerota bacterium]